MSLAPGTRLGSYDILSPLGHGGMGEVYRARDRKLGRDVALKLLPQSVIGDPARLARFHREAQVLASLNHPHIAQIYEIDDANGASFLVLELVEGATLAERLRLGPLSVEESVRIARQIAEAMETAHEKGIIHRDLKPANIALTSKGQVKVLDFGLAKGVEGSAKSGPYLPPDPEHTELSTITSPAVMTDVGVILGTAAYMSPEQARGKPVDARTDIWAFGCVLYEMLTGDRPFLGDTVVDVIAMILTREPNWERLSSRTTPELRRIVRCALEKDVNARPNDIAVLRRELEELPSAAAPSGGARSIAVLPFTFLNEVEDQQALSLGFADALITTLGNVENVTVAPTSAILRYAPGTEPRRVCQELGVRQVLQGNVQKLGAQWRVSIQMFDAASQRITLSEKHNFRMEDVFEVQDEIGRRVATALESRFATAAPKSRDRYSSDPEAYGEFMAGLRASYDDSPEGTRRAADHLTQAVERDPDFALAHAWLSYVSMQALFNFEAERVWLERAERHYARALQLDSSLPEAHWAGAAILWSPAKNFRHAEAITALERALDGRPNFDRAWNRLSTICQHIGRLPEGWLAHERALKSNPANPSRNREWLLLYSGDFVAAENAAAAWLQQAPSNLSALYYGPQPPLMLGQLDLAEARLEESRRRNFNDPGIVSLRAMLHARRGEEEQALACVRQSLDVPISLGHAHHTYYQVACVYAVLGDVDKALAWLEQSADTGNPCWPFFKVDPHLDRLRQHTRFQDLVARLERETMAIKIRPIG